MTFEEVLDHALAMLQRRGRLTYHTLQRQFHLDDLAAVAFDTATLAHDVAHLEPSRTAPDRGDGPAAGGWQNAPERT